LLTLGAVRSWYNTCIYFQDVKDFLFCAIVVIITNYAAAEKKMSSKTIIDVYEFEPYPLGRPPEAPFKSNTCSSGTTVITEN
jgi:hypothetical protein